MFIQSAKLSRIIHLLKTGKLLYEIKSHLRSKTGKRADKILPVIELEELIGDEAEMKLTESDGIDGNVTDEELRTICRVVGWFKPETIFEIGTFDGRTTLNMAMNAPPSCRIYTLDLPRSKISQTRLRIKTGDLKFINKERSGARFTDTPFEKRITQFYADSAGFDYSPFYNSIDLIFIDGSHSYDYVVSDTRNCRKLLRNGKGIIIWHDYGWHEVVKALNEFYRTDPFFAGMKNIRGTTVAVLIAR